MNENHAITFDNLPDAVQHLLQEVAYIKNHLLNDVGRTAEPTLFEQVNEFLTVDDISQTLSISKGTVYNMTSDQMIPHFKRGGRLYFDKEEIDAWIRNDRRKTIKQLQEEAELKVHKK